MPPLQYLRHLRLEEARRLLENSFKQVKVIAAAVGLPDRSHFTRDFKEKYGCTPSEYRRKVWLESEDQDNI
jgi:AraC-like DNA-binding protein